MLSISKAMCIYNNTNTTYTNRSISDMDLSTSSTTNSSNSVQLKRSNSSNTHRGISSLPSKRKRHMSSYSNQHGESYADATDLQYPPELSLTNANIDIIQEQFKLLNCDEQCLDSIISVLNHCCDVDIWNNRYIYI